jgi:DNA-binding NarL/FixJ family response regulator
MRPAVNVLLVDDHPAIQRILAEVASQAIPRARIHLAASLEEAQERSRGAGPMDLAVLDLGLPGCSGIQALVRFRAAQPEVPVVIFSETEESAIVRSALAAGAAGFIPKSSSCEIVASAIRLVASGGRYIPSQALAGPEPPARKLSLNAREIELLRLVVKGLRNREIAAELKLTEGTVKQRLHAVYTTLGVSSRTQAIHAAARSGLSLD